MANVSAEQYYDSISGRLDLMPYPRLLQVMEEHPSAIIRASAVLHVVKAKARWDTRHGTRAASPGLPDGDCALCNLNRAIAWCGHTGRGDRVAICVSCLDKVHAVARKPLGEGTYCPQGGATSSHVPNLGVDDGSS